jgi:hypothetical protein
VTETAAGDAGSGVATDDSIAIAAAAATAVEEVGAEVGARVAIGVRLLVVLSVDAVAVLVATRESGAGREKEDAGLDLARAAHARHYDGAPSAVCTREKIRRAVQRRA